MKKKLNFAFSFYICYVVVDYFIGKEFFVVLFFFLILIINFVIVVVFFVQHLIYYYYRIKFKIYYIYYFLIFCFISILSRHFSFFALSHSFARSLSNLFYKNIQKVKKKLWFQQHIFILSFFLIIHFFLFCFILFKKNSSNSCCWT